MKIVNSHQKNLYYQNITKLLIKIFSTPLSPHPLLHPSPKSFFLLFDVFDLGSSIGPSRHPRRLRREHWHPSSFWSLCFLHLSLLSHLFVPFFCAVFHLVTIFATHSTMLTISSAHLTNCTLRHAWSVQMARPSPSYSPLSIHHQSSMGQCRSSSEFLATYFA